MTSNGPGKVGDKTAALLVEERLVQARKALTPLVLRRTKEKALPGFASKSETLLIVPMTLSQKEVYIAPVEHSGSDFQYRRSLAAHALLARPKRHHGDENISILVSKLIERKKASGKRSQEEMARIARIEKDKWTVRPDGSTFPSSCIELTCSSHSLL